MKKCLAVFMLFIPGLGMCMSYDTRLTNVENNLATVRNNITEIKNSLNKIQSILADEGGIGEILRILEDKPDPDDHTGMTIIPGLRTKVKNNEDNIKNFQTAMQSFQHSNQTISDTLTMLTTTITDLSTQMGEVSITASDLKIRMDNVETSLNTNITASWEKFLGEKFQEYLKIKKQVLDVIAACKKDGVPTPTYIMETSEQLMACDLDTRRTALAQILEKLNVFASLLNSENLEAIQNYLNNTKVSEPQLQEVGEILPGVIIDGSYVKVTGATRAFTRTAGFKTGLPKRDWMKNDYDYFPYGSRPRLEKAIDQENTNRIAKNSEIEQSNRMAKAAYTAAIQAANRMTFPSSELTDLITSYNRLLTHHDV